MALLPTFQSNDAVFQMLQTKWSAILNPIITNQPQQNSLPTDDSLNIVNVDSDGTMDSYTAQELGTEITANILPADADAIGVAMTSVGANAIAADVNSTSSAANVVNLGLPPGMIAPYAGASAPSGWLLCDGSAVSTTTYAALFAVIGYTYGGSGGSFNLPNTQGVFLRGAGSQTISAVTYTGTRGTTEGDQLQTHRHGVALKANGSIVANNIQLAAAGNTYVFSSDGTIGNNAGGTNSGDGNTKDPTTGRSGSETRPANISVNYIIKI